MPDRIGICAVLLLLCACGGREPAAGPESAQPAAESRNAGGESLFISASVRVEACDEALLFGSGRVTGVFVEEGDSVTAGQVLVGLSGDALVDGAVAAGLSGLESARVEASNAEADYERCRELFEAGALSSEQMEGAETALLASRSALQAARSDLYGALSGRTASTVDAPFDGIAGRVWAGEGMMAGNDPLVMVTGGGGFVLRALLPERSIGVVGEGEQARFVTSALPGESFTGTVTSVSPGIDPVTGLLPVTVTLDDTSGVLFPGIYGTVRIEAGEGRVDPPAAD